MKFRTFLVRQALSGTNLDINEIMEGAFASKDIGCILGLDMQDGGTVALSRESWNRLEVFMALLSGVEMSISEEKLKTIIEANCK
jgi:hypothetical protein